MGVLLIQPQLVKEGAATTWASLILLFNYFLFEVVTEVGVCKYSCVVDYKVLI